VLFLIDTSDSTVKYNLSNILDSHRSSIKNIHINTKFENDINILLCASFEEIINHIIFFDDNIDEIVVKLK